MELNENQGLNPKKDKGFNSIPLVITKKIAGVFRIPSFREGLFITFCFGLLITLLQLNLFPRALEVKVGQASPVDVITPRDVVDREATKIAEKEAVERAITVARQDPEFFMIDESVNRMAVFQLNRFFELMDQERAKYNKKEFKTVLPADLPSSKFTPYFSKLPRFSLLKKILQLPDSLYQELKIKTHDLVMEMESNQRLDPEQLDQQQPIIATFVAQRQIKPALRNVLLELVTISLRPNLTPNAVKFAKLENQIKSEIPEVIHGQNELLVSKNQVVTENDMRMLKELHLITDESNRIKVFLSLSFFVLILIGLGWIYIWRFHPELLEQERMLYLLLMLIILVVGLIKVLSLVDNSAVPYLAPVSFAAMLITILIDPQLALAMTIILSLLGGIIVDYSLALTIFYFISGVVAVLSLTHFQRQRDMVRCGLILMVSNAVIAIVLNLLFRSSFNFPSVLLATTNGFLSAVLAIGSLPFLEHIFRITSPIRLLELSNPGNPLLRRLQIEAPGTYHHSIMVGNLAEAAAEGIGADALWVRVGSYYHDIGKIKRPYFFVENQFAQENPHEKLNPTLSTLIITYHVKEGAEIAREHGLPQKLIEIIEQHHGTDLVRYFYRRATESVQGEREVLSEENFRYEGPKPQTKEAALVMLADSVEAAVKSLPKPTPSKVEALVQKIIRERLDDGQFDECSLTLKDLNEVKNSFIKVLGGMFHNRIEYPENVLKEIERKKTNVDSGK